MRLIVFLLSLNLFAQSGLFLVPPIDTLRIYDTVRKGVTKVLQSVFGRKKTEIRLAEELALPVPVERTLPDASKTEFLSLVLNNLCSTEEEYYAELCRLESLLEADQPLDGKQLFVLQILRDYFARNPRKTEAFSEKQIGQNTLNVPVIVVPIGPVLTAAVRQYSEASQTESGADLSPEILDQFNESQRTSRVKRLSRFLGSAIHEAVWGWSDPTGNSPQAQELGKFVFRLASELELPPVVLFGAAVILDRVLGCDVLDERTQGVDERLTAVSLYTAAQVLEKRHLEEEKFACHVEIPIDSLHRIMLDFSVIARFNFHLPPEWTRELWSLILNGNVCLDQINTLYDRIPLNPPVKCSEVSRNSFGPGLSLLAKGAYGDVWGCHQTVYKFLRSGELSSLLAEGVCGFALSHPNLAYLSEIVIYSGSGGERVGLVMPNFGLDLYQRFTKPNHRVPRIILMDYMRQLLSGLNHLHKNEIIHGDIKTKNMFLQETKMGGLVKLGDFSLARVQEQAICHTNFEIQTVYCRAPEIFSDPMRAGFESDVWAMGCVFAELARGEILFQVLGWHSESGYARIVQEGIQAFLGASRDEEKHQDLLSVLGPEGYDLLLRMLCVDPGERITAQEALEHPFFQ